MRTSAYKATTYNWSTKVSLLFAVLVHSGGPVDLGWQWHSRGRLGMSINRWQDMWQSTRSTASSLSLSRDQVTWWAYDYGLTHMFPILLLWHLVSLYSSLIHSPHNDSAFNRDALTVWLSLPILCPLVWLHLSVLCSSQVPQYQPKSAFAMFERYLHKKPF